MSPGNEIVPIDQDLEWADIVNQLVDSLNEDEVLPEKVVQATELLLVGHPVSEVARQVGSTTQTVRKWISRYPVMAATLANGRALLSKWRLTKLEQQFLKAVERSNEVLNLSLTGSVEEHGAQLHADPKILTVVAAQSRYIIGLFAGQKSDIQVTHEMGSSVLKAQENALDYIAERLRDQQDGAVIDAIETTYRVVDEKQESGPLLESDGQPIHGQLGVLDIDAVGIQCHVCGNRFKALHNHLSGKHNLSTGDYELIYMLEKGAVRAAQGG